jgi:hypothetical protein
MYERGVTSIEVCNVSRRWYLARSVIDTPVHDPYGADLRARTSLRVSFTVQAKGVLLIACLDRCSQWHGRGSPPGR